MHGVLTDISKLSDSDLIDLLATIDASLNLITKAGTPKKSLAIEARMSKILTKAWKTTANNTLVKALKPLVVKPLTNKSINKFLKKFDVALKTPLTKKQIALLGESIKSIWTISKKAATREIKSEFNFAMKDQRAIRAINKQQVLWVGDFYNEQLSGRIRGVTEDVMLNQGLSQKEGGKALNKALKQEFGITPGGKSDFAPSIPARYAGNPDLYFEQLASTSSHQSRTFGRVTAFGEAEIKRYRLVNPMDERTGRICNQMHGQTFSVVVGTNQMTKMLSAQKPEDIKNIAPWLSGAEIEKELKGTEKGSKAATARLKDKGVILPPFHPRCRTDPVAIS